MKKALFFLLILTNVFAYAIAEDEVILKSGAKAKIKPQTFKVDLETKSISYVTENSNATVKVNFSEVSTVEFGINKFEVIKIEGTKTLEGYFVIAENDKYKMISRNVPTMDESINEYEFYILGNDNSVVEHHVFDDKKNQKSSTERAEIYGKVKFYFPENSMLLKRLEMYDRNSFAIDNVTILAFFKNPIYFKNKG